MKKLIPMLFVVMILATGCPQPEAEVHQVEIGMFTPYQMLPEVLNGQVKQVIEMNFLAIEKDGELVKGERLTLADRDSVGWTNDFRLTYDESGNLLLCELIDENDDVISWQKQTVEDGQIVKNEYSSKDTIRNYSLLTYDETGNLAKIEVFRLPQDSLTMSARIVTDVNGNFLEWHFMDGNGDPTTRYIFTVNQDGRRTGYTFYNKDGEKAFEEIFTFDDMGSLVRQVMIGIDGEQTVAEYVYEYDEMNNWVKCIGETSDGQTVFVERTITYFE